ncbi:hypothetical protein AVEN_175275-1 [Araneus ventricosus]|uniref:Uncharacterized protein n=1 Tax=Araneus ventricosus TaxID=182803 RepID=A0A4Y2F0Z2_ARAVE|nr:hypothetical protein AVEN_175275-1 [Araneus ventricosus]
MTNSADFLIEVAEIQCKMNTTTNCGRKRKSDVEEGTQKKKHKGPAQQILPKPGNQDEIGHWPNSTEETSFCSQRKEYNPKGNETAFKEINRVTDFKMVNLEMNSYISTF